MSAGMPPSNSFLATMQMIEQRRRQRETDALQRARDADQRALQLAQLPTTKKKDIIGALGSDMSNQGLAQLNIAMDARDADLKARESKENEAGAAQQMRSILPFLAQQIPNGNVNTVEFAETLRALSSTGPMGHETLDPIIREFVTMVQTAPLQRMAQEQEARSAQEKLQQDERIKGNEQIRTSNLSTANRLAQEGNAKLAEQANAAKYEALSQSLANAYRGDPTNLTPTLQHIQSQMENPALEMPIVMGMANKVYAAASDAATISSEYAAQGFNVPIGLAKKVVDGTADRDEFTGLVSIDPGEKGDEMRQNRAASMYALTELREIARKIVTGPMSGKSLTERAAWTATQYAKYEAGAQDTDPLYAEFRNRRDQLVAAMARSNFTGQMSNQERAFTDDLVLRSRMLAGNESGTDLAPSLLANFNGLYGSLETKYRVAIPRSVFDDATLRRVLEERKREHAAGFRSDFLDVQYPAAQDAGGWTMVE